MTALDALSGLFLSPTPLDVSFASPDPTGTLAADVAGVAQTAGLGTGAFGIVAAGNNAILINYSDQIVARVPLRPNAIPADEILRGAATAFAGGAPITPPASGTVHWLPDGRPVTFWVLGAPVEPSLRDVGQALARLHAVEPTRLSDWRLRDWQSKYEERIVVARSIGLPVGIADQMQAACDGSFDEANRCWQPDDPRVIVHGDPFPSNLVRVGGRLAFCDLDSLGIGPPEADLAVIEVVSRRFLGDASWQQCLDGYGRQYDSERLRVIGAVREVGLITWMALMWVRQPDQQARAMVELLHRLDTLTTSPTERWNAI